MRSSRLSALTGALLFVVAIAGPAEASRLKVSSSIGSRENRSATAPVDSTTFTLIDGTSAAGGAGLDTSQTISLVSLNWFDNPYAVTTATRAWLVIRTASVMDSCSLGYLVSMDGVSWAVGAANANATVKSTVTYSGTSGWAALPFAPDPDAAGTSANSILFPFIRITSSGDANTDYVRCTYQVVLTSDTGTP